MSILTFWTENEHQKAWLPCWEPSSVRLLKLGEALDLAHVCGLILLVAGPLIAEGAAETGALLTSLERLRVSRLTAEKNIGP